MLLSNKNIVIVGGTSGIGFAWSNASEVRQGLERFSNALSVCFDE
jgi:NAD(P)-dependent dehydrogenase (short-subunit alcohol dehydrogenase family)